MQTDLQKLINKIKTVNNEKEDVPKDLIKNNPSSPNIKNEAKSFSREREKDNDKDLRLNSLTKLNQQHLRDNTNSYNPWTDFKN